MAAATVVTRMPTVGEMRDRVRNSAFVFRGYNVTNLGRTPELLAHGDYGPIVADYLRRASTVCSDITQRPCDLVERVEQQRETDLESYADAIALIVAVELAQLEILREVLDIAPEKAKLLYGFSLGEITALMAAGVLKFEDALRIPLSMAEYSAALAHDVQLAVLFSRGREISREAVHRLCTDINREGKGVVGVSAYLAPNSMLIIGQGDTLKRFTDRAGEISKDRIFLRRNDNVWPPLHTPIVWQQFVPNRASQLMLTMQGGDKVPCPPVLSLVTGDTSYNETNVRDLLGRWVDHPQKLWEAVDRTLSMGIETVLHVGPQPNIVPATFQRLAKNVEEQVKASLGMRALSTFVSRPWLQAMLPKRTSLLRAPLVAQINLEDWLLDHP